MKVKVPQLAWHNPRDFEMEFPDSWAVETHHIAGHDRPELTPEQIKAAIAHPMGMPPLHEMARGKKQVAILFDDLTRSTRVAKIVPSILAELAAAGIADQNIRFIAAVGTHGPMTRPDLVKKLGESVVTRFAVYNHNAFGDLTYVGTTSRGNKVMVNTEVMNCDLKIAINSASPHPMVVYSGGGKNILPGVCSIDTVRFNHNMIKFTPEENRDYDRNPRRLDMEEAAKLAGLDMIIECLVNAWGESCAIFAGAEPVAHDACVKEARKHYLATKATDCDVVVANAYVKAEEYASSTLMAVSLRKGGDLVVLANSPDGHCIHYLIAGWGSTLKQHEFVQPAMANVNRFFLYNEYPLGGMDHGAQQVTSWGPIAKALRDTYGSKAKVAVYPSADLLYFA